MPDRVLTCTAYDDATGTCTVQVWAQPATPFPTLTIPEGEQIGHAILMAIIPVLVIKFFLAPGTHKR